MDQPKTSVLTQDGIDPRKLVERATALFSPLRTTEHHSQLIDVALEHMLAEVVDYDIERTMGTMVSEPRHEYFGCPGLETVPLVGYNAVREYYLSTFALPPGRSGMDLLHVGIGDEACFMEGIFFYTGAGAMVKFPEFAQQLDLERRCVLRKRHLMVITFEGGKIASELHYLDGPFSLNDVEYLD